MTITIEKGIPAPTKPSSRSKFPFGEMEVGDSFVVELNGHASWAFAFEAIQYAQNKHNIKLTTRLVEPAKRRVWRTA